MKELTRKQKLEFLERYMEEPLNDVHDGFICIALKEFLLSKQKLENDFVGCESLPKDYLPELHLFNPGKTDFMLILGESKELDIRILVISFLKAMI